MENQTSPSTLIVRLRNASSICDKVLKFFARRAARNKLCGFAAAGLGAFATGSQNNCNAERISVKNKRRFMRCVSVSGESIMQELLSHPLFIIFGSITLMSVIPSIAHYWHKVRRAELDA